MEFTKVIETRRSIREYRTTPIPEDVFLRLHRALSAAPSANNGQPCTFIFVRDPKVRERLVREGCHQEGFLNAPCIVVACCRPDHEFDCAIAVDHLILAATNEGLGTCWVGWIDREAIRALLNIPEHVAVPVVIPLGYAAEGPEARPRKPMSELICTDAYHKA
jgi:nitroreductase